MRVIKLGGSLTQSGQLIACLNHIADSAAQQTVIVPGGGEFANQVRLAQQQWAFNDYAAHHMAILAMQQMALLLNALQPDWRLLNSLDALARHHSISIWFPEIALLNQQAIPASWAITSDSLAAWLAGKLSATTLELIKSAPCPANTSLKAFVEQGILDTAFLNYSQPHCYKISILNSHDFLHQ